MRGPDRGSVFKDRTDIGIEGEFLVRSITREKASKDESRLPRGFLCSSDNMMRERKLNINDNPEGRAVSALR